MNDIKKEIRTGWTSWLAIVAFAVLLFEGVTGLLVTFAPFSAVIEWSVLIHTLIGVRDIAADRLVPTRCSTGRTTSSYTMSHVVLLGYVGVVWRSWSASVSGLVVTLAGSVRGDACRTPGARFI